MASLNDEAIRNQSRAYLKNVEVSMDNKNKMSELVRTLENEVRQKDQQLHAKDLMIKELEGKFEKESLKAQNRVNEVEA